MAGKIVTDYEIRMHADTSNITSQVNQLKTTFNEIQNMKFDDFMNMKNKGGGGDPVKLRQEYDQLQTTIKAVDTALTQAFNKDLGTLNVAKFNQSINSSVGGIQNVGTALNSMGTKGQQAFKSLATELLTVNHQLRQSGGFLASMAQTMANTVKWGIASSVMNNFTGTVKKAYGYVKHLDSSLNDIRIVTGKSSDEMDKFAVKANKAAQSLGQSTTAYTEAALIYYQQGLGDVDVEARANVTLKAANVTGQTGEEVSEQLTAVWNGYKVSAEESELYIDKLAAVAANSASNLEELSTGMSKVASAANAMGVDVDQLNAQLSTIISVTRQAPESVGTALKTIYARMSDLKLGNEDEDGIGLGDVSGTMESMGIDVMDASGNLRDMGDVIEDVAAKWGTWTEAQQTAMAQAMAGKRQYNNLVALFENWDMYERSKDVSEGSAGTLQKQQDIYMESTAAHLKQLKAEWEDLYDSLMDPKQINGVVDGLTKVVNLMGAWVDGIGGGVNMFAMLGSVAMNVFSRQIATGLTNTILKFQASKQMAADMRAEMELTKQIDTTKNNAGDLRVLVDMKKQQLAVTQAMTQQEYELANKMIEEKAVLQDQAAALKEKSQAAIDFYNNKQSDPNQQLNMGSSSEDKAKAARDLTVDAAKLKNGASAITDTQNALDNFIESQRKLKDNSNNPIIKKEAFNNATQSYQDLKNAVQGTISTSQEWIKNNRVQGESAQRLTEINKELQKVNLRSADGQKKAQQLLLEVDSIRKKSIKTINGNIDALKNNDAALEENANKVNKLSQRWNQFFQEINLRSQIQNFTTIISKVGQLASAVNMMVNIPSIFKDETLSAHEKFLRITMATTTAIPMLMTGIMGMKDAYQAMTTSLRAAIAANEVMRALEGEAIVETSVLNAQRLGAIGVQSNMTTADMLSNIVRELGIELSEEEQKNLSAEIVLQKIKNSQVKAGVTEDQKKTAQELLNLQIEKKKHASILTTIKLNAKKALSYALTNPYILAASAAIIALTLATTLLLKAEKTREERLKKATETYEQATTKAAELRTQYKELTTEIENFKESISDYQEGINALKNLDTSTEEYKNKVKELNEEARNLIETLNLWDNYSIQSGVITIDQEALDKALILKENESQLLQRKLLVAQSEVNNAKVNLDIVKLENKMLDNIGGATDRWSEDYLDWSNGTGQYSDKGAFSGLSQDFQDEYDEVFIDTNGGQKIDLSAETVRAFDETLEKIKFDKDTKDLPEFQQIAETVEQLWTGATEAEKEQLVSLGELYSANMEREVDAVIASLEKMEAANLDYAEQILGLTVRNEYSEEILALATKDGKVDYELAERIFQGSEGAAANTLVEDPNDPTKQITLTQYSAQRIREYGQATEDFATNNDTKSMQTLINMVGGLENFKPIYAAITGSEYDSAHSLTTAQIAEIVAEKRGLTGITVQDPDDGKGTLNVTFDDKDSSGGRGSWSDYNNKAAWSDFINLFLDEAIAQDQTRILEEQNFSVSQIGTDIKNIEASQFGASKEQMEQFYVDTLNNRDLSALESLFLHFSASEVQKLQEIDPEKNPEEILQMFGLTEPMVQRAGYENAEDFAKGTQEYFKKNYKEEDSFAAANSWGETEAEKYDIALEHFKAYRDYIKKEEPDKSAEEINERALIDLRMEKGVKDLSSSWKDHEKILRDTKASAVDLTRVYADMKGPLQNILNLTDEEIELLPEDFAKQNVDLIDDVMNGVEGSVHKLRAKWQDAWGDGYLLEINPELEDTDLFSEIQRLQDQILTYNPEFKVGVSLDEVKQKALYDAFNAIVANAGMTVAQAEEYFKQLGYDVVVETGVGEVEGFMDLPASVVSTYQNNANFLPEPIRQKLKMQLPAAAIKVITPNGSYGGGITTNGTPSPSSIADKGGGGDNKPEKIEAFESEVDRYHDVENELKKLNTLLERQERIASKLTGKDRIAAIQKQISLLQEQNEKQKEKLKLMQEEAAELKKKLQGEGVKFDAEGDISNYKALLKAKEDEINNMIDEANSKSSADAQEKIKEDIENAKKEYEELREWIERYETLMYDEMPGLEDEMQEAWDKQIELQIEAFEIEIQLKLDLQDTKRQLNEFMREVIEGIEDDEYGKIQEYIAKDLPTYFGETGTAQANYDALQKALKEYQTIKNGGIGEIFGDDANAAWEKVMELKDETLDSLSEVKDLIDQMEENYLNAIEAASEEFAEHLEQYEQIQSILDHNIKLIEMLAGDEAYDAQLAYYKQMERNNLGQVDEARRVLEFWRQQKAAAEEGSEAWKEANAKEKEAQEQLNALVEQSVETIKTKYEKTVSKIIKDLNNAVTSGKGLDALSQEWELINQEADMYLDTVNSAYEIQKLENKMIDAIDNASSLKAKQRLNELMEKELGMLKDKDKLSQYEVDRANQLLDIEMKKIALEEAQRNKSTMRLRRDAQGNYSYQYVTDNDAVAKAQEELNEAQNSLFNLDKDAYKENLDQILSLWTDFQTKLNEIWTNNNLTDEQKQQQAYELRERYMRMISGLTQDNENIRLNLEVSTFSELARLRNMDIQDFQNMADEQKKILLEQVIPQWSSGLQSLAEQFKDENGFTSLMNQAFKDLQTNLANYQKSLKDLEKNAGIKFEKIISGAEDYSKEIQNLINKNKTIVNDQSEILKGIRDSIDATKKWVEEFNKLADAAKETLDTIIQIQEKENKKDTSNANNSQNNKSEDKKDSSSNKDNGSSSSKSSSGGDGKLTTGETVTYVGGPYYETSAGGGKSGSRGPGKKVTVTRISKGEKYPIQVESDDSASGWLKEDQLTGYGTGGYTGDWSSRDGRLAVLHEKELVLNKQDTKNILAAVDMVRSLNNSLTSRMANLFNHSSVDKLIQLFEKDSAPLEQNVQITASFPNVSVEHEIEEAFNSLISSASQYAFNTLK